MTEFGHFASHGKGICMDSWGAGPYVLTAGGKRYVFEGSDRFGPALLDVCTGNPTNVMIPPGSPFWKVWERWRDEGRQVKEGRPLGKGGRKLTVMYCVHSSGRE